MNADGIGDTYAFDAENHIATASGIHVTGGTWSYIYDGNGLRVAKCDNETSSPCAMAAGGTLY
jgi:YD repeat-containing protein